MTAVLDSAVITGGERASRPVRIVPDVPLFAPAAPASAGEAELAARLVPCDRCGACQHQACATADGLVHGVRRLLAIDRGHLDAVTGVWLTRGWWS